MQAQPLKRVWLSGSGGLGSHGLVVGLRLVPFGESASLSALVEALGVLGAQSENSCRTGRGDADGAEQWRGGDPVGQGPARRASKLKEEL